MKKLLILLLIAITSCTSFNEIGHQSADGVINSIYTNSDSLSYHLNSITSKSATTFRDTLLSSTTKENAINIILPIRDSILSNESQQFFYQLMDTLLIKLDHFIISNNSKVYLSELRDTLLGYNTLKRILEFRNVFINDTVKAFIDNITKLTVSNINTEVGEQKENIKTDIKEIIYIISAITLVFIVIIFYLKYRLNKYIKLTNIMTTEIEKEDNKNIKLGIKKKTEDNKINGFTNKILQNQGIK